MSVSAGAGRGEAARPLGWEIVPRFVTRVIDPFVHPLEAGVPKRISCGSIQLLVACICGSSHGILLACIVFISDTRAQERRPRRFVEPTDRLVMARSRSFPDRALHS